MAAHITDLLKKSSFPRGVARMSCRRPSFKSSLSLMISHAFVLEIKFNTKKEVSIKEISIISSKVAIFEFVHQLSSQKLFMVASPLSIICLSEIDGDF